MLDQNGYIVGAPTYLPVRELAICRPIAGAVPRPGFPDPLAASAAARWEGRAGVWLMFARGYARAADAVCCAGTLACAVLCTAHARLAGRREWVLNEKRLAQRGGLDQLQRVHAHAGTTSAQLSAAVDTVSAVLDITTADPPLIHAALL